MPGVRITKMRETHLAWIWNFFWRRKRREGKISSRGGGLGVISRFFKERKNRSGWGMEKRDEWNVRFPKLWNDPVKGLSALIFFWNKDWKRGGSCVRIRRVYGVRELASWNIPYKFPAETGVLAPWISSPYFLLSIPFSRFFNAIVDPLIRITWLAGSIFFLSLSFVSFERKNLCVDCWKIEGLRWWFFSSFLSFVSY